MRETAWQALQLLARSAGNALGEDLKVGLYCLKDWVSGGLSGDTMASFIGNQADAMLMRQLGCNSDQNPWPEATL